MENPYPIAINEVEDETIVNRSRFICFLKPCTSTFDAKTLVKYTQKLHPQASHHCYAFVAGTATDSQLYGFSDDGEPSGTAGRPMLSVLQGSGIGQVCAVVVRYFGGTKLGTGGLQRAYGASVRQALGFLQTKIKIAMVHKTLACQYTQVNDVFHVVELAEAEVINQNFSEQVALTIAIPEKKLDWFQHQLLTLSAGKLLLKKLADDTES